MLYQQSTSAETEFEVAVETEEKQWLCAVTIATTAGEQRQHVARDTWYFYYFKHLVLGTFTISNNWYLVLLLFQTLDTWYFYYFK